MFQIEGRVSPGGLLTGQRDVGNPKKTAALEESS